MKQKQQLKATQLVIGHPCPYCTRPMSTPTRDHIRPKSRFPCVGVDKPGRLGRMIIVCNDCNLMKDNMTLEEFVLYLKELVRTNNDRIFNIEYLLRIGIDKE